MSSSSARADGDLVAETSAFAEVLTTTARAVTPECEPFQAVVLGNRVAVRQDPPTGIPLTVSGSPLLTLKADFGCSWDTRGRFLTIERSSFSVVAGTKSGHPLFRYEYLRNAQQVPAAHLHVHAHRDAVTYLMARTGASSARGRRRAASGADTVPALQDLHFPLGGHRFRPALEDVLEMLMDEFGVDHGPDARGVLREARARWRIIQTRAAARDAPEAAAECLRDLGYQVAPPQGRGHAGRGGERLRAL